MGLMWTAAPGCPAERRLRGSGTDRMPNLPDNPMDSSPAQTFTASRWTQGNFFFPTRLVISPQRVTRIKPRLFGSNEESIGMTKVASVHISTGVFWSEIVIESTGGTDPITSHGHRKARRSTHSRPDRELSGAIAGLVIAPRRSELSLYELDCA